MPFYDTILDISKRCVMMANSTEYGLRVRDS